MATLIPSIGSCVSRMTGGERRRAERLEAKLDDDYAPSADIIQIMTMKVSNGLEFPVVTLPSVEYMPAPAENEKEVARLFFVAAALTAPTLILAICGEDTFEPKLWMQPVDA